MKTYFIFDRTVRLDKGTFTKGQVEKAAIVRRANKGRLPVNGHLLEEADAKIIINNFSIMEAREKVKGQTVLEIADGNTTHAAEFELAIEYLVSHGVDRDDIAIGVGTCTTRRGTGKVSAWVGTKMETYDDIFIGRNMKEVTLQCDNYISTNTLMSRINNDLPLFAHGEF